MKELDKYLLELKKKGELWEFNLELSIHAYATIIHSLPREVINEFKDLREWATITNYIKSRVKYLSLVDICD